MSVWDRLGVKPWDYEIDCLRVEGMPEHEARNKVVMQWMQVGDFRPLLAMIRESQLGVLRGPVLNLLVQMLANGRLKLSGGPGGRPFNPEIAVRDQVVADVFEDCRECFLVDETGEPIPVHVLVEILGGMACVSEDSIRQVLKARRKSKPLPE